MMIKFSWKKINDNFDWNAYSVLHYFYQKQKIISPRYLGEVPRKVNIYVDKPYPRGPCFLISIDEALKNTIDPIHLYQYLELASKRNIFDYHVRGLLYLPEILVPEYLKPWVERNPMLEKVEDKVYFKYEQE